MMILEIHWQECFITSNLIIKTYNIIDVHIINAELQSYNMTVWSKNVSKQTKKLTN